MDRIELDQSARCTSAGLSHLRHSGGCLSGEASGVQGDRSRAKQHDPRRVHQEAGWIDNKRRKEPCLGNLEVPNFAAGSVLWT